MSCGAAPIDMRVNDQEMGATVELAGSGELEIEATFSSFYPVQRVELVHNGTVVHQEQFAPGAREGAMRSSLRVDRDGWVAVRCWSDRRDSFDHSIYAHGSPVYFVCGREVYARLAHQAG